MSLDDNDLENQRENVPMTQMNELDQAAFMARFGATFENSPWVAEAAWASAPFRDVRAVHDAMCDAVRRAPKPRILALLCAHPDLAGKEAREGTMTDDSIAEQSGAGLDALSREEMDAITRLNRTYREKHGFPFIIAVRQHTKAGIFAQFEQRIANDTEVELENALQQIFTITALRLGLDVAG